MAEWVKKGSLIGPQGPKGDTGDTGPKGDAGETGPKGETGATGATPVISMTATVDQTTGTPSVSVSKSGSDEAPSFNLAITGIKGEKGDKGDTGDQGPQGDTGPQGPAGADAELPAGGTEGQVLTKTEDGEAWADVPETDMTGVVKRESNGSLNVENFTLGEFGVGSYANFSYSGGGNITLASAAGYASFTAKTSDGYVAELGAAYDNSPYLKMGSKIVHSITDDASGGSADALTTAKAVADYINSLIATDEEFDTYMGLS